jgi:hypothetical protein
MLEFPIFFERSRGGKIQTQRIFSIEVSSILTLFGVGSGDATGPLRSAIVADASNQGAQTPSMTLMLSYSGISGLAKPSSFSRSISLFLRLF